MHFYVSEPLLALLIGSVLGVLICVVECPLYLISATCFVKVGHWLFFKGMVHADHLVFSRAFWKDYLHHCGQDITLGYGEYFQGSFQGEWRLQAFSPGGLRSWCMNYFQSLNLHPLIEQFLVGSGRASDFQKIIMQSTGTLHLMAISGLHIDIIAGGMERLGGRFFKGRASLQLFRGFVALVLIFYSYLVGYAIPVQRAIIMRIVKIAGSMWGCRINGWLAWEIALITILIIHPLVILSVSFYLSFAAVACLLMARDDHWKGINLSLGTACLGLWFFGFYPLISPLVNYWLIPLFRIITPCVMLGGFLAIIFPGSYWFLDALSSLCDWVDNELRDMSLGYWIVAESSLHLLLMCAAIVSFIVAARTRFAMCVLLLSMVVRQMMSSVPWGEFRFTQFEVGHGLMVAIETHRHYLVYDTARSGRWLRQHLIKDWHKRGFSRPSGVIISHPDLDHRGGLDLLKQVAPHVHVMGNQYDHKRLITCLAGAHWSWDGVLFWIIGPDSLRLKGNDASCVLYVRAQNGQSLLIPGDAMKNLGWGKSWVDDLIPPHHGRGQSLWYMHTWKFDEENM